MKNLATKTALALWLVLAGAAVQADSLTGTVVRVIDGDTVVLLDKNKDQHRIRLAGIDTPERGQPFGNRAKQTLADLIGGEPVLVQFNKRDRWGRIIGKILKDGQDQNLIVVREGMAWWFRRYQKEHSPEDRKVYERAETAARKERKGLWSDPEPIAPWDWRRR